MAVRHPEQPSLAHPEFVSVSPSDESTPEHVRHFGSALLLYWYNRTQALLDGCIERGMELCCSLPDFNE